MNYEQQVEHYKAVRARIANAHKKEKQQEYITPRPVQRIIVDPRMEILRQCADEFSVTVSDILGDCKAQPILMARWKAAWLIHQRGRMSISAIGKYLKKDHSTILNALKKYEKSLAQGEAE